MSDDPRVEAERRIRDSGVRCGDHWHHRKGRTYQVVGFAVDEATREPIVLYVPCPISGDTLEASGELASMPWSRLLSVFLERDVDGVRRFEFLRRAGEAAS